MRTNIESSVFFAFLDTSVLFTLLGCSIPIDNVRRNTHKRILVLHQVHYNEAIRRLQKAVFQLINTERDGDQCLERLARQVLQRLRVSTIRARSLRELGRLTINIRKEAQKLLHGLITSNNILILDDGSELTNTIHGIRRCPGLSDEDLLLIGLAAECHVIVSNDNEVISCCLNNIKNQAKCIRL